jgi:hypothetical protein
MFAVSRHSLAPKKIPIFHSDPKALFRVIFREQYSGIWGRAGFLTCFLIDLVPEFDFRDSPTLGGKRN